jgi:ribosomal protein S12 methylthiotransferase accessory factor YcaO
MNIIDIDKHSSLPSSLFYQPPCFRGFPFNVEVSDTWSKIGSGAGDEVSAPQAALGEYFERRHFYMEVFPEKRSTLKKILNRSEAESFIKAFTQIYPSRDTCGCSFHWSPQAAMFGSIKESLERQFLTKFWLTKECVKRLDYSEIDEYLNSSNILPLYKALTKSGEVVVLDISDDRFPGKCLISLYGNQDKTRNVRYCTGMSYAKSPEAALEKSINELWQTYRFIRAHKYPKKNENRRIFLHKIRRHLRYEIYA